MNLIKLSGLLGLWVIGHTVQAQSVDTVDTSQPMNLEECLAYAFANNANVDNAELERKIADRDVSVTKTQGFPQINANVGYTNNFIIQTTLLEPGGPFGNGGAPGSPPSEEPIEFPFGIANQALANVTVEQLIFDGSYFIGLKAARVYTNLARKSLEQTKVVTAEQVTKAYYTALVNQERQTLLNSNYQRLDTLLRETKLMFENGFAEKIDVGRIQVQFNNANTERKQNERLTEVSYLLLKFQMGMPIDQDIALADKISGIDFNFEQAAESNFSYADRTEYAQVLINQNLSKLDLQNNRIQYLPKLTASASYGYNSGASQFADLTNFGDRWFDYGNWGLNLNIPIFDGLRKHHTIQKNKLQLQQLENQAGFLKNQIDLEIVQARVNLQNNLETLEVQQENLELAEEVFEVTKIKYQAGVGSNLEVTEAQNALQSAETNYYNALYSALIARVDLKKALGTLVDTTDN
ncbi:MAG: TolC family protein [Tunicatimonas sp.]